MSHPLYDEAYDTKVPTGICKIQAGEWPSTVASQALLEGTIECLPGEDIHQVKADFKRYILEWSAKDSWFKRRPVICRSSGSVSGSTPPRLTRIMPWCIR